MLDHISIPVREFAKAAKFYDAVLATVGLKRTKEREGAIGYGTAVGLPPEFWILEQHDPSAACSGIGLHLSFRVQSREESDVRFVRYRDCFKTNRYCRWAIERRGDATFLGYTGIQPVDFPGHPLEGSVEIGWRLVRAAWGQGIASEAARATLRDGF